MSSAALPLHAHPSVLQRIAHLIRGLMYRVQAIDLRYVDPWERKRR